MGKRLIYKIKNFKNENFEIAKSFPGSFRVQRYIVFMSLHNSSASYWTSKKGLPCDLSKMPEAITRWPLLVELQYWLSRLQRVRLPYRPSFRFLLNMRVLILEIFGRFVLECPRSQLKSVNGADRLRLCGHVKLSLLNSAANPEYSNRKVWVRACATSSASCGLCPRQSFHSKGSN